MYTNTAVYMYTVTNTPEELSCWLSLLEVKETEKDTTTNTARFLPVYKYTSGRHYAYTNTLTAHIRVLHPCT